MKLKTSKRYDAGLKKLLLRFPGVLDRLDRLTGEISESPRRGIGWPEQLRGYQPRVVWSRRIIGKHRLVYEIMPDCIILLSCYGHYKDH